jgi:O-antigen ligase
LKKTIRQIIADNIWIAILGIPMAAISAFRPMISFYLTILMVMFYSFKDRRILLIFVLIFVPVSTFPAFTEYAASIEIEILAGLRINFMGMIRTALACVLFLHTIIIMKNNWRIVWKDAKWFVLFWAYAALSILWSPRWAYTESWRLLVQLTLAFCLYVFILQFAYREEQAMLVVKALFVLAIVFTIGSLINSTFLPEMSEAGISNMDRGERFIGLAASPNILAGNLAIFISIGMAFLSIPKISLRWRRRAILIIILSAIPLLLTISRSGWSGVGLAWIIIALLRRKWHWLAIFMVIGIGVMISPIGERFLGDWRLAIGGQQLSTVRGYQNAYGRIEDTWLPAIRALVTPGSVVVGRGVGVAQSWAFSELTQAMHSEILQIVIDFGIIGFGLLSLGFLFVIRRSLKILRTRSWPFMKAMGIMGLAVIASMVPKLAWDHVFNGPSGWLLLMTSSLAVGASRWSRQDAGEGPEICRNRANL